MEVLGKLQKFWFHIDFMTLRKRTRASVQENDYQLRLGSYKAFILLYFFNIYNYARYGAYYDKVMRNMEKLYPGNKEILLISDISVQVQERYPTRTTKLICEANKASNVTPKLLKVLQNFQPNKPVYKWCTSKYSCHISEYNN